MFTKTGVLLTMMIVWILGVGAVLPDALGVTGDMTWTDTLYGCDTKTHPRWLWSYSDGYGIKIS